MDDSSSDTHYLPLLPPVPVQLIDFSPHVCSYLPDRAAMTRGLFVRQMPGEMYHLFMDAGFRRNGRVLYQTNCDTCRECVPLRVAVAEFHPSKSQRRAAAVNRDLSVVVAEPRLTDEKFELYRRYVTQWHGGETATDGDPWQDLQQFLYDSPVDTIQFNYRDRSDRLLAVGICDVCESSLSSVYFYFDPADRHRSLGTAGALFEIDWARGRRIPFYYLGYWVRGCHRMAYKANFQPCQVLTPGGDWVDGTNIPPQ